MRKITVGCAALNQIPFDWKDNVQHCLDAITEAKRLGVKLLCLPELCITGYGCEDQFFSESLIQTAFSYLQYIASFAEGISVCIGFPFTLNGVLYNGAALLSCKKIVGIVPKQYLAVSGVHYEARWFKPWKRGTVTVYTHNGESIPCGDLIFDFQGIKAGVEICEDAWLADRPGNSLSLRGADVILNPSASHFSFGKHETRKGFITDASRAFHVVYCYANLLGCESGRTIYDGDALIASEGRIIASNERFSFNNFSLVTATVDCDRNRNNKKRVMQVEKIAFEGNGTIHVDTTLLTHSFSLTPSIEQKNTYEVKSKFYEFTAAVTLGLFDYLRKSKMKGYVVSLSGGADSSAVSVLVYYTVLRAQKALGKEGFLKKLSLEDAFSSVETAERCMEELLCCIYQKTENNSKETEVSAKELVKSISATFYSVSISEILKNYLSLISEATKNSLSWEKDGISLQNIQARVRSPGVWLIANIRNALLLTTGNRSETAVGYATMDGDTSGGFNPIGGVDKPFLLSWLKFIEKNSIDDLPPVPSLKWVNALKPSAELKPLSAHQTDEGDLMSYILLNRIERLAVCENRSPLEAWDILKKEESLLLSSEELKAAIIRFYTLLSQNQWKRERLAPAFQLDDYSLDPKSWYRFPILNGGFSEELEQLKNNQ
jgi:NAD+ synthase (glutamine-hydrolysing)